LHNNAKYVTLYFLSNSLMNNQKVQRFMESKFENYQFLHEPLILYKENEIIPLQRNQAVLLGLFLSNPEKIHSKDAIMDSVWHGKVVSEQVVFQTISQLRAVFGNKAIKTFSKKGYKWQLKINQEDITDTAITSAAIQAYPKSAIFRSTRLLMVLSLIFIFSIFAFIHYSQQATDNNAIQFHLLHYSNKTEADNSKFNKILTRAIDNNSSFIAQKATIASSARQAFSSPKRIWQQAKLKNSDWLVWGNTYDSDKGIFLHYGLVQNNKNWQGYLFANNVVQLQQKLNTQLIKLKDMGLFSAQNPEIDINTLMVMSTISPNDPDLLLLYANHYISVQHLDVAMTYLQKLIDLDASYAFSPYLANAYWAIGKIYKMRSQHLQASNSLDSMSQVLADTPLWRLNFEYIETKVWLSYEQADYEVMFETLKQGLSLGEKQVDPLTLFELHMLYSIMAQKTSDSHSKYEHLNLAQALLIKHKLDDSNLALVYYHFALFTDNNEKAIPYLERILTLPRTVQNDWILDLSFEMLINLHIEHQTFSSAHALFKNPPNSPKELLLKARLFQAEQKFALAQPLLIKAFELARLKHDIHTGLQAALTLYRLSAAQPKIRAQYIAYIESNAKPSWLKHHNVVLASK